MSIYIWLRRFTPPMSVTDRGLSRGISKREDGESWFSCWKRRYQYWKQDYASHGTEIVWPEIRLLLTSLVAQAVYLLIQLLLMSFVVCAGIAIALVLLATISVLFF